MERKIKARFGKRVFACVSYLNMLQSIVEYCSRYKPEVKPFLKSFFEESNLTLDESLAVLKKIKDAGIKVDESDSSVESDSSD